eukprot:GFYU01027099.1.p1 GENE.GFYU01027099.1~~GFYU01027099.1.p1  ORF type:complete len:462 (-),score=148.91 GFYU01027099.1:23-1408(-)
MNSLPTIKKATTLAVVLMCVSMSLTCLAATMAAPSTVSHATVNTQVAGDGPSQVLDMARKLLVDSFNAGSGYPEVWIRDGMTFLEVAMDVNTHEYVKKSLLPFFSFQTAAGEMPDGYIDKGDMVNILRAYEEDGDSTGWGWCQGTNVVCKNNVETDQETSLVQAVHIYVTKSDDVAFLSQEVKGISIIDRLELALTFLMNERRDSATGLITGATTCDWGDIQPENVPGTYLTPDTHYAVDIYDNAMFILAVDAYVELCALVGKDPEHWRTVSDPHRAAVRKVLWDEANEKFIPHHYLAEGSPFDASFDENSIYYHGGTAVAAQAKILSRDEVKNAYDRMKKNVGQVASQGGNVTIGMTVYPPYPAGSFKNLAKEYNYQNAGDWDWFGGRMVQALVVHGLVDEAVEALEPMVERAIAFDGFFEWFDFHGQPQGSAKFHGSAGVLGKAIEMVQTAVRERQLRE